jgi:hypothetical protein
VRYSGYYGPSCTACPGSDSCNGGCSGNGICSGSGTSSGKGTCSCKFHFTGALCTECIPLWTGVDCMSCIKDHWGFNCTECPGGPSNVCNQRGVCDDGVRGNGQCVCETGWALNEEGLCKGCLHGYWGQECQYGLPWTTWTTLIVIASIITSCCCLCLGCKIRSVCCKKKPPSDSLSEPLISESTPQKPVNAVTQLAQARMSQRQVEPVVNLADRLSSLRLAAP